MYKYEVAEKKAERLIKDSFINFSFFPAFKLGDSSNKIVNRLKMKNISQQLGNFENYQDLLDSIIYFMRLEGVERTEICTLLGYSTRTMARRFNGEKIFAYPEMAKILEHLKLPEISEKGYYVLIGAGRQQHIPSTTTEKQSEVYLQSIDDLIAKSEILPQELSNEIKSLVETAKQNHLFSGSKESLDEYASLKKIQIYLERQSQK